MVRSGQIRLYPTSPNLAVGGKGLAETFLELDLPQLGIDRVGYLSLIFSADALSEGGTAYDTLASSAQYAVALGERLRDKVYEEIIPDLSLAVAEQMIDLGYEMDADELDLAYQITLRIFFRLLFQVYAEDRHLLPFKENDRYTRNALKTLATDLVENADEEFDPESATLWDDLAQVWHVIDAGDRAWGVPAYNGGLFSSDKELHPHGALISRLRIHNDVMGPILRALLLDSGADGETGPIDFRSLSVREFGTIYEGLLESSLGLAEVDLTLDDRGTWLPAKKKSDEIYAYAGQVYFHNTSGQRKSTGSYFTPSFVVEHLLERSLDPALDDHLSRVGELIKNGDQAGAADLFFDFKVADLAMGSGHFLTAAIDHIEVKMAAFLAEDSNHIPGVASELSKLFAAAKEATGPDSPDPEPSSLLRRQIARRCIYGLDVNPIAVELARVSIWIHTFVRGLPMSSLDHNLVCGNSLTGIGSVEEALDVLVPGRTGAGTLFDAPIEEALKRAQTVLVDVANLPELNRKETQAASRAVQKARKEAEMARLLFDASVLRRVGRLDLADGVDPALIARSASLDAAQAALAPLQPAHMPALFPEVFLRANSGFDVLIGNPPWEELHVNSDKFWVRYHPGHMNLPDREKEKRRDQYGKDRPDLQSLLEAEQVAADNQRTAIRAVCRASDLYQAFLWRYLALLNESGTVGAVLPRGTTVGASLVDWRRPALKVGALTDVMHCVNKGGWMFPEVHPQTQIILLCYGRSSTGTVTTQGVARSAQDLKSLGARAGLLLDAAALSAISESLIVPAVPRPDLLATFMKMREHTSLGSLQGDLAVEIGFDGAARVARDARRVDASEVDARGLIQGRHIRHWHPPAPEEWLSPSTSVRLATGPGVVFRQLARSDDSRTFICSIAPASTFVKETGYWLVPRSGSHEYLRFLLGVLSSRVFDWYVRCLVDRRILPSLASSFPVPEFNPSDTVHAAIEASVATMFSDSDVGGCGFVGGAVDPRATEAVIDALAARAFGITSSDLAGIFETFHPTWEFETHRALALDAFESFDA